MHSKGVTAFLGPAEEAGRLYFRGADTVMKGVHPAYRSAMRANLEVAGFGVRRTRAALELGWKVSRCKSPVEAADHVTRFWMSAFEDLMNVNTRALEAFAPAAVVGVDAQVDATVADWPSEAQSFTPDTAPRRERDRLDVTASGKSRADAADATDRGRVPEAA